MAIEGVGEAVSGGLLARAVEPEASGTTAARTDPSDVDTHPATCLNCETRLIASYCHECGQSSHVHRTITALWHDLSHGVLHLDGKVWRTLPMLFFRPGQLTRRYIDGERAGFVSPVALFLFSIFFIFAVISLSGGLTINGEAESVSTEIDDRSRTVRERLAVLERDRIDAVARGDRAGARNLNERVRAARIELGVLDRLQTDGSADVTTTPATADVFGPQTINQAYQRAKSNSSLFLYKVQNNAYKFSWALIPISLPFMWLLFPMSRKFRMYDHAVFVTYSITFVTILTTLVSLAAAAGLRGPTVGMVLVGGVVAHMYVQLRGTYRLSRRGAAIRTFALLLMCGVVITLFLILLLVLGALG